MSTILLLHLDEPNGVQPADSTGNVDNLGADPLTTAPASVVTWAGRGRAFTQAGSTALITDDISEAGTVILRDLSIQAILSLTLAGAAGAQTIICRGVHDGTPGEAVCWGLELQEQAAHAGYVEVRWFWEDSTGARKVEPPGVFQSPGDGKFFLLTATRRWEATGRVVVRYYVGDQLLGELVSANGDIAGGTTGHTTLGGRKTAGAWVSFFQGVIDELAVLDLELSHEEIRQTWQRLTIHQPAGVDMFVGLSPVKSFWYDDPSNQIGRFVKLVGQALGLSIAATEELRALWLPDAVPLETVGRWESLCGISPKPRDSLDVRRARLLAFLGREEGFSLPAIENVLAELLALAPSQVQILEFTNEQADSFDTLSLQRWRVGDVGTWAAAGGVLTLARTAGPDLRWDPTRATCNVRMSLAATTGRHIVVGTLVSFWGTLPVNTIVGLFLYNRRSQNAMWFGVMNVAGVLKLGYRAFVAGVLGAFVVIENPALGQATWLKIAGTKDGIPGKFVLSYSITGPSTGFTDTTVTTGMVDPEWAGFAAMSTDAALASNLSASFDDFAALSYNGLRTFEWYAFRDPTLPGIPDMAGAQALVQKVKPAHTYAAATESLEVLCDSARDGGCDRGPLGAL